MLKFTLDSAWKRMLVFLNSFQLGSNVTTWAQQMWSGKTAAPPTPITCWLMPGQKQTQRECRRSTVSFLHQRSYSIIRMLIVGVGHLEANGGIFLSDLTPWVIHVFRVCPLTDSSATRRSWLRFNHGGVGLVRLYLFYYIEFVLLELFVIKNLVFLIWVFCGFAFLIIYYQTKSFEVETVQFSPHHYYKEKH